MTPIDAVVTWVDGNDPEHRLKRAQYLPKKEKLTADINGETRFNSVGEINYCIASILKFAPFFRKIFIVTDHQDPKIDHFLKTHFPETSTTIEIIDHQEIFEGYEEYLPVFNSISIESMLFRIKDLSEKFVYFNDDFFLLKPLSPHDFFVGNIPITSGSYRYTLIDRFLSLIKPVIQGRRNFGYKDSLINVFKFIPFRLYYWYLNHAPTPLLKSVFKDFYEKNPNALINNIQHKFRDHQQYNTQSLFYQLLISQKTPFTTSGKTSLFLRPNIKNKNYLIRKLDKIAEDPRLSFCCAESLDQYPNDLQEFFFNRLKSILRLH